MLNVLEQRLKKRNFLNSNTQIHENRANKDALYRLLMCYDEELILDSGVKVAVINRLLQDMWQLLDKTYGSEFTNDYFIKKVRDLIWKSAMDLSPESCRIKLFVFITHMAREKPIEQVFCQLCTTKEEIKRVQRVCKNIREKHLPQTLQLPYIKGDWISNPMHVNNVVNNFLKKVIEDYVVPQTYSPQNSQRVSLIQKIHHHQDPMS